MRTWKNGILLPFLLVLLWYIISKLQIFSSYLLPSPAATAITAGELIRSGMLWQHLLISLQRVAGGFLCSVVVALPLGTQQLFSVLLLAYPGIPASCAAFGCNTADNPLVWH